MISTATILSCLVTLFICLLLPPLILIIFSAKNRGQRLPTAWLLGAAGFFATQILIRLPILSFLQTQNWFLSFAENHMFAYAFLLSLTAGLFELAGRFAVAYMMRKNLTFRRSIAAGLGHGGIEAMLLIGVTYVNNLIYILMIRSGAFHAVIAEAAAAGVEPAQLYAIQDALINTSPALFLLAGFERILSMTAHVGMSAIVCYGVHCKKPLVGALICLAIHTLLDLTAGINLLAGNGLSQTAAYLIIYAILTAAAALSLWILKEIRSRWPETEVTHHV